MPDQRQPTRRKLLSAMLAAPLFSPRTAFAGLSQEAVPPFRSLTGQFTLELPRRRLGSLRILGMYGKPTKIEVSRGRPTLLCFWATWCPPCRRELPMLERLHVEQSRLVNVRPIAIDREGARVVAPFMKKIGVRRLPTLLDPDSAVAKPVGAEGDAPFVLWGMPLTYLVDADGSVAGSLVGEADWTSPEGLTLLRHFASR